MDVIERLTMGLGRVWDENNVYYNEAQIADAELHV